MQKITRDFVVDNLNYKSIILNAEGISVEQLECALVNSYIAHADRVYNMYNGLFYIENLDVFEVESAEDLEELLAAGYTILDVTLNGRDLFLRDFGDQYNLRSGTQECNCANCAYASWDGMLAPSCWCQKNSGNITGSHYISPEHPGSVCDLHKNVDEFLAEKEAAPITEEELSYILHPRKSPCRYCIRPEEECSSCNLDDTTAISEGVRSKYHGVAQMYANALEDLSEVIELLCNVYGTIKTLEKDSTLDVNSILAEHLKSHVVGVRKVYSAEHDRIAKEVDVTSEVIDFINDVQHDLQTKMQGMLSALSGVRNR